MTVKFNGASFSDEFMGKNLQFYTVITTENIIPSGLVAPYWEIPVFPVTDNDGVSYTAGPAAGAQEQAYTQAWFRQQIFEKMIEVIMERGNPIILGQPEAVDPGGAVAGLEAYGTGPGDVYVFRFALEQEYAWKVEGTPGAGVAVGDLPEEYLDFRLNGITLYDGPNSVVPSGTLPGEPYAGATYANVPNFIKDPVTATNNNVTVRRSETLPLNIQWS